MSRFLKALRLADRKQAAPTQPGPSRERAVRLLAPGPSRNGVDPHLVSLLDPTSRLAEPYRGIRHLVEQRHRTTQLSIVAVSSAIVGDGKTTTAINLAGALAQAPEARVLLVDADLRRPSIARRLGFRAGRGRGLVEAVLNPSLTLQDVVTPRPAFNLDVLPAGQPPASPYEMLQSPRLGELLADARHRYDYVVLDTTPLVGLPDTQLLSKWIDGFLVVVAAHRTPRKLLEEAVQLLDPVKLVGLVLNEDNPAQSRYYYPAYYAASPNGDQRTGWRARRRRGPRPSRSE